MTVSRIHPSAAPSSPGPPAWIVAAELLCLLFVIIEVCVLVWGGFRLRLGGWRISLTSPYRMLFWFAVVGGVRYAGARGWKLQLPGLLSSLWRPPGVRAAVTVLAGTRPAILFVGYLFVIMFGY